MIYFTTSNRQIAAALRHRLGLKAAPPSLPFPLYEREGALLCLSGPDPLDIASGVSALLAARPGGKNLLLISLEEGIPLESGRCPREWTLCTGFCGKDGRPWYPDILAAHPFFEGGAAWEAPDQTAYWLFRDPGAWALVRAASHFLAPHQILCLRCAGLEEGLAKEPFRRLTDWCLQADRLLCQRTPVLTDREEETIRQLAGSMFLSHTMTLQLRQLLIYQKLSRGSLEEGISGFLEQLKMEPCQNKREGKTAFEQLRQHILL